MLALSGYFFPQFVALVRKLDFFRGAYVSRLDVRAPNHVGVVNKMAAQVAALQAELGPVEHFKLNDLDVMRNGSVLCRKGPRLFARQRLYAFGFYGNIIAHLRQSDYIYIRYQRCTPMFLRFLWKLKKDNPNRPVLVEFPTYPYDAEHVTFRDRFLGIVDRSIRSRMIGLVDRIVTFSDFDRIFGIPTIRTQNGVNLSAMPLARPSMDEGPLRLVAVANLGVRHAYDRVIAGLAAYQGARPVHFEIIGSGSAENELRAQVAALGLADRVRFAGPLSGAVLNTRLSQAHMGVAALGMHRIATSTTDLKSREYCARGLPFVTANLDSDFGTSFPFSLQVPADDGPLDIATLDAFYSQLRKDHPDFAGEMRAYAETSLGWDSKMRPVIEEIRNMLQPQVS